MKRLFFINLLVVAVVRFTVAQPAPVFQNDGQLISPPSPAPQVDATTFINNGLFNIGFNNFTTNGQVNTSLIGAIVFSTQIAPFDFSDVLFFTNRGSMVCDTGFTFDTAPATSGFRHMAASFGNANSGSILAGTANTSFTSSLVFFAGPGLSFLTGVPLVTISATNVVNSGLVSVGANGIIGLDGVDLKLNRGTLHVEGFDDPAITQNSFNLGIFGNYQGIGNQTNVLFVGNSTFGFPGNLSLPSPESPINKVNNNAGLQTVSLVAPPLATAFVNVTTGVSNVFTQVVYINTNLTGISTDVRFLGGGGFNNGGFATPIIQWEAVITNKLAGLGQSITTNDLYLEDVFGSFPTNFVVTNSFTLSGAPQISPYNYSFFRAFPGYTNLPSGNSAFDAQALYAKAFPETNAYSAYGVTVGPVTTFPDPTLPGSTVTNTSGRIQINAATRLDLTSAKITGPNYLKLFSTNHFVGSTNAQIIAPFMDISLGSTNGLLAVTNLVAPNIPRFTGPIDMWSGRWTNVDATGITNTFHVLIVNAQLAPTALPLVLNCALRSTNVIVSDIMNIDQTLLINANNVTITSNSPNAATPYGQINVFSPDIIWSASFPTTQNLTNSGLISTVNTTYFLGARQIPYYPTSFTEPYQSFVNHGLITSSGSSIWANHFENTGIGDGSLVISNTSSISISISNSSALIFSSAGPISVQATTALMASGGMAAPAGDLTITANALTVSNHFLLASGALTLSVTNTLTDDGAVSSNAWSVGDGMNLLIKPAAGDLLGTTITNTSPAGLEVINIWAGADLGASPAGYANNSAVGHLILDGGNTASQFFFGGPDTTANYALYVDQLDLRNGATNRASINGIENFTAFDVADNMKIYFADAVIGQFDISEKLNGANGGHLVWVPSYAGTFSSTNMVYPPGNTNTFNRALVQSTDIDSNGNGIANAFDPTPIFIAGNVNLSVSMTNSPSKAPVLKWFGLANSTNYLYYTSSLANTNWLLVTNFVQGSANGAVTVVDRVRTNGSGYYKVRVNAQQP